MNLTRTCLDTTPPSIFQDLIRLVDCAGSEIMDVYRANDAPETLIKADQSPLTEADLRSNEVLITGLAKLWPSIPILSEEGGSIGSEQIRPLCYWAIDPLDGTKEFLNRNDEFTVNVALIFDEKPVLGVVLAPALNLLYVGYHHPEYLHVIPSFQKQGALPRGCCAMHRSVDNWQHIHVSQYSLKVNDRPPNVVTSRSHPSKDLDAWLQLFPQPPKIMDVGSSLKLCYVAQGLADVYPRFGPTSIWDTAAGHAIILAAGGTIFDVYKNPLRYPSDCILNPHFIAYGLSTQWLEGFGV